MTENSRICQYMLTHNTWREDMKKLNIKVKDDGPLTILSYGPEADFSNPIVQEARGIIINRDTLDVICWPFRKFGNWQEEYADDIDWSTARVQEKVDGSIIKLYWYDNAWRWATNSCINADETNAGDTGMSFGQLIRKAENYPIVEKHIDDNLFDKSFTYIFELVSPFTQVVVSYPFTKLYHTGTRNNKTGEEIVCDIGIPHPKEYSLKTFDDCIAAAEKLNQGENVEAEGFVVVDSRWNRIKIKSPEYIAMHHLLNNHIITKTSACTMLMTDEAAVREMMSASLEATARFKFYDYQLARLELEISRYIRYVRNLYCELSNERKAVALTIKGDKLAQFGFKAIGNEKNAKDIMNEFPLSTLLRYIDDYPT